MELKTFTQKQVEELRDMYYKQFQHLIEVRRIAEDEAGDLHVEYINYRHPDFFRDSHAGIIEIKTISRV